MIAYFIQNLLVFDMINTYLVFFLALGFISFLIEKPKDLRVETTRKSINPILAIAIIAAVSYMLWWGNIKPIIANYYILKSVGTQYIDQVVIFFQKSLSSSMNKYESREYFAQRVIRSTRQSVDENVLPFFLKAIDMAEAEMEKSIQDNPLDFRHYLFLGELYVNSYYFGKNPEELARAQAVLERAIELSPTNQQGYWQLAEIKTAQGKVGEAIPLLEKAVELEPRIGRAHWYLAMAYHIAGNPQSARVAILKAEKYGFGIKDDINNLQRVIEIFRAVGDDEKLIGLYLKAIEFDPKNTDFWASLAASYANVGQYDKAREVVQRVIEIDHDMAPQVEQFLKSLAK